MTPRSNAFYVSLFLHLIILASFVLSFEWSSRTPVLENSKEKNNIINAVMITDSKIQMPKPEAPPVVKPLPKPEPVKPVPVKPEPIKPAPVKPVETKVIPIAKKQPAPVPKKDVIAISDKRKKIVKEDLIEKQLLAELKQAQKQKKQSSLEEAFAKELKSQTAKAATEKQLKEKALAASAQAQKMQGIVDKYKALIIQAIAQNWMVPPGVNKTLTSQLLIRIAPGGVVLDVQLVRSSGDSALDQSAQTAVFKASPLPVPTDSEEFEPFRQFMLKVKPENLVSRDSDLMG